MATLDLREQAQHHKPALTNMPHLKEAAIATWTGRMINEHLVCSRVRRLGASQFAAAVAVSDIVDEVQGFRERRAAIDGRTLRRGFVEVRLGGSMRAREVLRRRR